MSARVAVLADPGRGCRGSLDDAAPPMDGPAGDEGMLLFNDLAFDSGFVARMDTLASRFADDFAHGRYDAGTAPARDPVPRRGGGHAHGDGDRRVIWRRGGRLRRESRAVRGDRRGQRICRRSRGSERLRSAGRGREPRGTPADPHARPGTLPCLRMFTTAYGKTDETDVFGDGAPVEGMESSSMQLTR